MAPSTEETVRESAPNMHVIIIDLKEHNWQNQPGFGFVRWARRVTARTHFHARGGDTLGLAFTVTENLAWGRLVLILVALPARWRHNAKGRTGRGSPTPRHPRLRDEFGCAGTTPPRLGPS